MFGEFSHDFSLIIQPNIALSRPSPVKLETSPKILPFSSPESSDLSKAKFRYDTIKTGPDGYSSIQSMNSSDTTSREEFNSFVTQDTFGTSTQNCLNSSFNLPIGESGASVGATGSRCSNSSSSVDFSHGYRNAKTTSESILDSASFQGGLTLQQAPFAQYPVGSLLAFVSPVGNEDLISKRIDVKVLGRQTTIYAPEDVTVSFVVNDCQEGNLNFSPGLSLQGEVLTPKTEGAKSLMQNILGQLPEFRKSAEALLKQGVAIDEQLSVKKSEFIAKLLESDANFYKISEIQGIVNFWIDNEILKIKRMAQINGKGREMARLNDETRRLGLQLEYLRSNLATYRIRLNDALARVLLSPLDAGIGKASDVVVKKILPILTTG